MRGLCDGQGGLARNLSRREHAGVADAARSHGCRAPGMFQLQARQLARADWACRQFANTWPAAACTNGGWAGTTDALFVSARRGPVRMALTVGVDVQAGAHAIQQSRDGGFDSCSSSLAAHDQQRRCGASNVLHGSIVLLTSGARGVSQVSHRKTPPKSPIGTDRHYTALP